MLVCVCGFMCVCVCVCVCSQTHLRRSYRREDQHTLTTNPHLHRPPLLVYRQPHKLPERHTLHHPPILGVRVLRAQTLNQPLFVRHVHGLQEHPSHAELPELRHVPHQEGQQPVAEVVAGGEVGEGGGACREDLLPHGHMVHEIVLGSLLAGPGTEHGPHLEARELLQEGCDGSACGVGSGVVAGFDGEAQVANVLEVGGVREWTAAGVNGEACDGWEGGHDAYQRGKGFYDWPIEVLEHWRALKGERRDFVSTLTEGLRARCHCVQAAPGPVVGDCQCRRQSSTDRKVLLEGLDPALTRGNVILGACAVDVERGCLGALQRPLLASE